MVPAVMEAAPTPVRSRAASVDGAPRVALIAGVCIRHDAISNVVRTQEELLLAAGYEVRVFTHHTDFPSPTHVEVTDPWILQRDEWYRSADLVILHFGIQYGLFDSLLLSHPGPRVVHFHNVTPPDLLSGRAKVQATAGIDQASIIERADRVWSDSFHNTECLLEWSDIDPSAVVTMPLCTPWAEVEHLARCPGAPVVASGVDRVIAVGRMVPAKGQLDLVEAVASLPPERLDRLEVDLIGTEDHSDPSYVAELRDTIERLGLAGVVRLELDLAEELLRQRYLDAKVFVSTSRHEGFCVPVIEALSAGCQVVVTDAGALPETVGECGRIVPVGDVSALASALGDSLTAGPVRSPARPGDRVAEHLHRFSRDAFRERTLHEVGELIARPAGLGAR